MLNKLVFITFVLSSQFQILGKSIIMLAENENMYKIYHDYHQQSLTLGMHVCKNLEVLKECVKILLMK